VIINPYYWKVAASNLDDYYHRIASSVRLPAIVYNFPDLTGQDLTPISSNGWRCKMKISSGLKTQSTASATCGR
jgi:hypothetical protein